MPAGSLAAMLKKAAEDHNLFVIIGCVNFGTNLLIGLMTILFDPSIPVLASDLNGAVGGLFTVRAILYPPNSNEAVEPETDYATF